MANLGCTACCASSRLFGPLDRTTFAGFTLSSFFHFHISLFVGCHALAFRFCDMLQSKLPASYAVGRTELPAAQPAAQRKLHSQLHSTRAADCVTGWQLALEHVAELEGKRVASHEK